MIPASPSSTYGQPWLTRCPPTKMRSLTRPSWTRAVAGEIVDHNAEEEAMIEEPALSLAKGPNFGAFTTMLPSGRPMTHVMWVDCDGDHILINTETHRAKFKNIQTNPNVAVAIWDRNDPYVYAEVRGTVVDTVAGDTA